MILVSPGQNWPVLVSDDIIRIPSTCRSNIKNYFSSFLFSQKRLLSRTTETTKKKKEKVTTQVRVREE